MTAVADAIDLFRQGCAAIAAVDRTACTPDELGRLVIGVGRLSDRLRAVHALHVLEADRARVWHPSGARNVAGWYSDRMAVGYVDAIKIIKLGDVLERSDRVLAAVLAGRLSAATAESLHAAIVQGPPGGDIDEFLDVILGPRPAPEPEPEPAADADDADVDTDDPSDDSSPSDDVPPPAPEPPGFDFGSDPTDAPRPGFGPKDGRQAAEAWNGSHRDPVDEAERLRAKRAVIAGAPIDGLANTNIVLPVLEQRQFLNTLDHIAGQPCQADERTPAQRRADALIALCNAYANGTVTGGREHPKVIVTIDIDSYLGTANRPGLSSMGDRIPAQVIRELARRAELRWMLHTGNEILELGRTQRLASDAQWEALIARDGGCRWPGCTIPAAWCQVDHLIAWEDGGTTDIDWLDLMCSHHHDVKHRAGVTVTGDANDFTIRLPDGTLVHCPPTGTLARRRQPEPGDPPGGPDELINDQAAARPDTHTPQQTGLFDAA